MRARAFSESSPAGVAGITLSSVIVAAIILLLDPDIAGRVWLAIAGGGLLLVFLWTASKRQGLDWHRVDQGVWAVLLSHTVLVSRFRDTHLLAESSGLTPEIFAEISLWSACLVYAGFRIFGDLSRLKSLTGPAARYASILFVAALASCLYAAGPLITIAWSFKLLTILLVATVLFDPKEREQSLRRFAGATLLGLVLMMVQFAFLGILSPEAALDRSPITGVMRLGGYLLPATQLSAVAGMTLALLVIDFFSEHGSRPRFALCCICVALMLLSLGRAGMLSSGLALVMIFAVFKRLRLMVGAAAILGIALLTAPGLLDLSWNFLSRKQSQDQILSLTGRVQLWGQTLDLIRERPLLGWGYVSGSRVALLGTFREWTPSHSHNAFLEILLALGIIGGIILLMLLTRILSRTTRALREAWDPSNPSPTQIVALKTLVMTLFLVVDGFFSASFSGAPRFEATVLIGCAFCADLIVARSAEERTH